MLGLPGGVMVTLTAPLVEMLLGRAPEVDPAPYLPAG